MALWLNTNIQAHGFISSEYWLSNFDIVRDILPKAQVFVYEDPEGIQGFVGLDQNGAIAGIFVSEDQQSKGIGKVLLDTCKRLYPALSLNVYIKNQRAIDFYVREGFAVKKKQIDKNTAEMEYSMGWEKQA
ncbi:MAG: putative acetyltransferase [Chloroflexota bacterium]|nr:putative acetyltransferase [Chloroflexota bacterium]